MVAVNALNTTHSPPPLSSLRMRFVGIPLMRFDIKEPRLIVMIGNHFDHRDNLISVRILGSLQVF